MTTAALMGGRFLYSQQQNVIVVKLRSGAVTEISYTLSVSYVVSVMSN